MKSVTFVDSSSGTQREFAKHLGGKPGRQFSATPTNSNNLSTIFAGGCDFEDLEGSGFIRNVAFCVQFELVSPDFE
ncbi:hypothetical protein MRX96_031819 [Rhipicephalus microplus]